MSLTFLHFDTLGLEQLAKLLDLLLEFADEFRVGVLVDDGLAYNLFGTVGISVLRERRHRNGKFISLIVFRFSAARTTSSWGLASSAADLPQRAQRFVVVDIGRRYRGNHGRFRVATEIFPQQPCQDGVTVRYEVCFLGLLAFRCLMVVVGSLWARRNID